VACTCGRVQRTATTCGGPPLRELGPFERDGRRGAPVVFRDRADAGRQLAAMLSGLGDARPVVLGLPRGGVPVAAEVARALHAPLDVILVRKLGVPFQPELAVGAVGEGGVRVVNEDVRRAAGVVDRDLAAIEAKERATLDRMARTFREGRAPLPLQGRTVVVVDDGIATGSTAKAACQVARAHGASRVVLAAPVIPSATLESLRPVADEIVCVESPEPFFAIGQWYVDFSQTSDDEVVRLLGGTVARTGTAGTVEEIAIPLPDGGALPGELSIPPRATGVVLFAHGSGSSRFSPRNQEVARRLRDAGLGTLLFDLLSEEEARDRSQVFDVQLLSSRLAAASASLHAREPSLAIGYFGASTGAAAALWAAADPTPPVAAIVSRGGRPDLARTRLAAVRAPTLLIVGEHDPEVLDLNREALALMHGERELVVVDGASHLFEEPGALERVADIAAKWFSAHFRNATPTERTR
jgi:putative phosphoribosyl transferase